MSIENIVDIIINLWNVLWNFRILNISIIIWATIPVALILIFDFIKGKKE